MELYLLQLSDEEIIKRAVVLAGAAGDSVSRKHTEIINVVKLFKKNLLLLFFQLIVRWNAASLITWDS